MKNKEITASVTILCTFFTDQTLLIIPPWGTRKTAPVSSPFCSYLLTFLWPIRSFLIHNSQESHHTERNSKD